MISCGSHFRDNPLFFIWVYVQIGHNVQLEHDIQFRHNVQLQHDIQFRHNV